jgi:hypothetical protein
LQALGQASTGFGMAASQMSGEHIDRSSASALAPEFGVFCRAFDLLNDL